MCENEKNALENLSLESYKTSTEDDAFLEAGITDCENYIDLTLLDDATVTASSNSPILVYEGFKKPFMPKSKYLFPEVIPFAAHTSQTNTDSDSKFSDLIDIFDAFAIQLVWS